MSVTGEKILSVLIDSLSVEELEILLDKKRNTEAPKIMSEEQKCINDYKNELIKLGILHPPIKKQIS